MHNLEEKKDKILIITQILHRQKLLSNMNMKMKKLKETKKGLCTKMTLKVSPININKDR